MKYLKFSTGDVSLNIIKHILLNNRVIGYGVPTSQNLSCAWIFNLYFEGFDKTLSFSSDVASSTGWKEYGYLRMDLKPVESNKELITYVAIEPIDISSLDILINEEDDIIAECGLILIGENKRWVVISTSPAPGAVSVKADFNTVGYKPEILLEQCSIKRI
ncbi:MULTISPECIES: hypothetical protein [unclassified Shewanella]|uniref:hypothetical protein n=1 Tax=unclassified Shewanella TaxID=196818 RepID=UPI00057A8A4C|nr:hypothetical protein [Shewanella sp. ECSMB14102]